MTQGPSNVAAVRTRDLVELAREAAARLAATSTITADAAALTEAVERLAAVSTADHHNAEHTTPTATTTLEHTKIWLRARLDEGTICPACNRNVRMYREKLSADMTQALLAQYRAAGTEMVDCANIWPSHGGKGPKAPQLKHWGILERGDAPRHWRITDHGVDWIAGRCTVMSHARTYNDRCYGLTGTPITVGDALGSPFDLTELMSARPFPQRSDTTTQMFPDTF